MKNFLLQAFAINLSAINNNVASLVLTSTTEPGSWEKLETKLYGEDGYDSPGYEVVIINIPEHVGKILTNHQAAAAYLAARLGETIGHDLPYDVQVVNDPDTKSYRYAIIPPEVVKWTIDQEIPEGNDERTFYHTFEQALVSAHNLKRDRPELNAIELSGWDEKANIVADYTYHYDAKALAGEDFHEEDEDDEA